MPKTSLHGRQQNKSDPHETCLFSPVKDSYIYNASSIQLSESVAARRVTALCRTMNIRLVGTVQYTGKRTRGAVSNAVAYS